jgi:hypothetical protein
MEPASVIKGDDPRRCATAGAGEREDLIICVRAAWPRDIAGTGWLGGGCIAPTGQQGPPSLWAFAGEDRTGTIAEQSLEPLSIAGLDVDCGVEREAAPVRPLAHLGHGLGREPSTGPLDPLSFERVLYYSGHPLPAFLPQTRPKRYLNIRRRSEVKLR